MANDMPSSLPRELPPAQEAARLAAVRRYDILDTPPDGAFDRVTALAADLFSVPISIVSLVDHDRIWFKSHHGLDVQQVDRAPGLCASAVLQNDSWILPDAARDIRSLSNPLVAGEFGLQFYVGVPLRTHDGHNLGTLCVLAREARTVTGQQIAQLQHLGSVVMDQMELRRSARQAVAQLSDAVAKKDVALRRSTLLAKEIDHLVKNSLQLVSGLLVLQGRSLGNADAAKHLALAASRVAAVGRIHELIYLSDDLDHVACKPYVKRLCEDLSLLARSADRAEIVVNAVDVTLPTARIMPLGLILNELVTNAIKHGEGAITVQLERAREGRFSLSVSDQGRGVNADFDPASSPGLGMRVVQSLAQQLGGQLRIDAAAGVPSARFTVEFRASGGSVE